MSVGAEPNKAWSGSSRYTIQYYLSYTFASHQYLILYLISTLDAAWSRILSEADEEATDHTNLAESIQNQVCEVLKAAERKKEATRKKVCFLISADRHAEAYHLSYS